MISAISIQQPPSAVMVNGYLTEIAKTFKIKWAPRKVD